MVQGISWVAWACLRLVQGEGVCLALDDGSKRILKLGLGVVAD